NGPTLRWWPTRSRSASSWCWRDSVRCEPAIVSTFIRKRAMKKLLTLAALTTAAALAGAQQAPEVAAKPAGGPVKGASYVVDPTHTFVNYEMGHYGTTTNRGRFSTKDGSIKIDPSGSTGKVDVTMDISSINTGVDLLNRHLMSKDFFNVAEFPIARFVAGQIDFSGDKVTQVN